jgi:hypothetical protein
MKPTLDGNLISEIRMARALFERFGRALRQRPEMLRLLSLYAEAIDAAQDLMRETGVTTACTVCARKGAGSCCFEGIEAGYDHVLLLINLLLGGTVPDFREVSGSCFFVGKEGCKLRARYYYCVHYLCPTLQGDLGPVTKQQLLCTVGKELAACWELEQAIREWRRKESAAAPMMLK